LDTGLRVGARLAHCDPAGHLKLMVTEKMLALVEAAGTVAMGGSAHKVVSGYAAREKAPQRAEPDRHDKVRSFNVRKLPQAEEFACSGLSTLPLSPDAS
jgi:hypothetical protein